MSTYDHRGTSDAAGSSVQTRIAQLRDQVARRAQANRTRQHLILGIGGGVVALVAVCLSAVTKLTGQLDADSLAQIGRIEVQKRLPDARLALEQHLKREAPRLVADGLRSILDLMPRLRELLMQDINQRLETVNAEFKGQTLAHMTEVIQTSKAQIDQALPNLSEAERLTKLVEAVAGEFRTKVTTLTDELYPTYQAEMSRITAFLSDLADQEPSQLSREDQLKREVIEILLQLIVRHRAPSDAEFLSGQVQTPAFIKQAIYSIETNRARSVDPKPENDPIEPPEPKPAQGGSPSK
jgi:hypothetical protein